MDSKDIRNKSISAALHELDESIKNMHIGPTKKTRRNLQKKIDTLNKRVKQIKMLLFNAKVRADAAEAQLRVSARIIQSHEVEILSLRQLVRTLKDEIHEDAAGGAGIRVVVASMPPMAAPARPY